MISTGDKNQIILYLYLLRTSYIIQQHIYSLAVKHLKFENIKSKKKIVDAYFTTTILTYMASGICAINQFHINMILFDFFCYDCPFQPILIIWTINLAPSPHPTTIVAKCNKKMQL